MAEAQGRRHHRRRRRWWTILWMSLSLRVAVWDTPHTSHARLTIIINNTLIVRPQGATSEILTDSRGLFTIIL